MDRSRMEWSRGKIIGEGSYAKIYLATPKTPNSEFPPLMAVKSATPINTRMLENEKRILTDLKGCPEIIQCYGDDITASKGNTFYNVFLEFAPDGDLLDLAVKKPIGETDVRRYTRSILRGLQYIHKKGYIHCDIKPQNILIFPTQDGKTDVKIADFGAAKRVGSGKSIKNFFGTIVYMSPESLVEKEHKPSCDIWALGCVVVEMVTRRNAWKLDTITKLASSEELPEIPSELSVHGKDFLEKCWQRDCSKRWTAEML
ncbi:hypothetical protein Sjap_022454 [Stephania japonica]|uniref:Protein kinase domain-containing protein n=1 Tax=Stephania japonica TaxID=461633 RepID=A0AAP0HTP6_9MAGN